VAREAGRQDCVNQKGSPQQNAFVERFNGTMRDEVLTGEEFAAQDPWIHGDL
jgi:transposase InsO family protein